MTNKITLRNATSVNDTNLDSSESQTRQYEIDLPEMLSLLLRKRRWIIRSVGLVGVLTALLMILTPNRYTSTAVILPSGKSDNLSALKAMAGLTSMLGSNDANSSTLFPVILGSRLVRDSLFSKTYDFSFKGEPMHLGLAEYLGIDDPDRQREALGAMTQISSNTRTGEISVGVETKYPELSQALVTEYLRQLENFNLYSRRSEATERVRYLTRELANREAALRSAEDSVEAYQNRNRNWAGTSSPTLLKELTRLKREAEARTQTYAYLLQEYEIAKLDAQKDVPVVRLLDQASLPTLKSGPHRTITVLAAASVTFVLAVLTVFGTDLVRQWRHSSNLQSQNELISLISTSFPRTRGVYNRVRGHLERQAISVDK
jgi:uncharacterized protein involved in exopolysaccharide biosynthesis